jgi:glycerophosphoryl diester phosphodiesterase
MSHPLLIAHRGASGLAPENTHAAFRTALNYQPDFIECDVQLTKDKHVVVIHDATVDRTSSLKGAISDLTLAELQQGDYGKWYGQPYLNEPIPTLEEVITTYTNQTKLNIEIKGDDTPEDYIPRILDLLKDTNGVPNCIITSFHHTYLLELAQLDSQVVTGLIFAHEPSFEYLSQPWKYLSVHHKLLTATFVDAAHDHHKQVFAWTVNSIETMNTLIRMGVDGIITDYPNRFRQIQNL